MPEEFTCTWTRYYVRKANGEDVGRDYDEDEKDVKLNAVADAPDHPHVQGGLAAALDGGGDSDSDSEGGRDDPSEAPKLTKLYDLAKSLSRRAQANTHFIGFHGRSQSGEPGCDWFDGAALSRLIPTVLGMVDRVNRRGAPISRRDGAPWEPLPVDRVVGGAAGVPQQPTNYVVVE